MWLKLFLCENKTKFQSPKPWVSFLGELSGGKYGYKLGLLLMLVFGQWRRFCNRSFLLSLYNQDICGVSLWYKQSDAEEFVSCDKRSPSEVTFKKSLLRRNSWRVTEVCMVVRGPSCDTRAGFLSLCIF